MLSAATINPPNKLLSTHIVGLLCVHDSLHINFSHTLNTYIRKIYYRPENNLAIKAYCSHAYSAFSNNVLVFLLFSTAL